MLNVVPGNKQLCKYSGIPMGDTHQIFLVTTVVPRSNFYHVTTSLKGNGLLNVLVLLSNMTSIWAE